MTRLAERLGLTLPVVAAPMFLISNKEMLVAAAKAGILAAMPSLNLRTSEAFEETLAYLQAHCPGPYAINLTIGLTDPARLKRDLELCFEYEVPVLITSYGNPTPIVKAAHARGVVVFHDVIGLAHAKKAEAAGVDAIIAVSQGAGGHAGTLHPFVLVPWLRRELSVPIIAAGCISTGDGVAAALSLGAELAYVGTRFIASEECGAVDDYKALVVSSTHDDVVYTDAVSGVHANFLKSTIPEGQVAERGPQAAKRWRDIWSAGQGVTLVNDVKPIAGIVEDLRAEFDVARARLR